MKPRIAGVVLAAGRSSRMGPEHKLLADLHGEPLVRHTVRNALAALLDPVVVVTGHRADEVAAALAGLPVQLVYNPDFADGMASSLLTGLGAVPESCSGAAIVLGDMPRISPATIALLVDAAGTSVEALVAPVHDGRRGNPVILGRRWFNDLAGLSGDSGARQLLKDYGRNVTDVPVAEDTIFVDIDTPGELALARSMG
jgi:molybdenum cofactor cytidylyltransferase